MFALPDHHLVTLRGRDAAAFAQAQFMSDVAALADGDWQWSGWLMPKGRVIALFALLRADAETIALVLHDADPAQFAAQLQRFVFRSKVAIETGELEVGGAFEAHPAANGARTAMAPDGFAFDFSGDGGARTLWAGPGLASTDDLDARARWAAFDLAHGLPRLAESQIEKWTPQQLSLERLHAYSVKKGCYPGQEIVARTHFLGQAKRGLALFECDAPLEAGQQVMDGDRTLGAIASAATSGGQHLALAVLPLDAATAAAAVDGHPLRPLPLRDGLAR
ncbi:MAG TPA: folate-binding protein [Luteimonas sp.]